MEFGRYMLNDPTSAQAQALGNMRQNINRVGQFALQQKLGDIQRRKTLQDAIALKKAERSLDPFADILEGGKAVDALTSMSGAIADPTQKQALGNIAAKISGRMAGVYAPQPVKPTIQPQDEMATIDVVPSVKPNITPLFVSPGKDRMVEESRTMEPGVFGGEQVKSRKMFSPAAEETKILSKEAAEFKAKVAQSLITNENNINLVSGAGQDLASWLVGAYKEKGAGDVYRAAITKTAASGWLPQDIPFTKKVAAGKAISSGIKGKRTEMLMKMFPMLTQQLGKEGSIRLIESVMERLGQTIPDLETPPEMAATQLGGSIQSMFRIQRALEQVDIDSYDFANPTDINKFGDNIAQIAMGVTPTDEESAVLNDLINRSISPLVEYTGKALDVSGGQVAFQAPRQARQPAFRSPQQSGQYSVGQIINAPNGKKYRIIGGDMNDPDVEEVQ